MENGPPSKKMPDLETIHFFRGELLVSGSIEVDDSTLLTTHEV